MAVLAGLGLCASASAQITVGQVAPDLVSANGACGSDSGYNEAQRAVASGASYVVPSAGVLTSWSSRTAASGALGLVVYRPLAGSYLVAAVDGPRLLGPNSLSTFPISIPVVAGDLIGTVLPPGGSSECLFKGIPGDEIMYQSGNASVGGTVSMTDTEPALRVNVSATLLPPPTIASISPANASIKGGSATILGANFAGVSAVSFGSAPATSFTVDSEGQITAIAPASKKLAKVPVTVTTIAGVATSAQTFAYEGCKVPQLQGKKLKASKKKAKKADCKIGKVTKLDAATGKTGKVVKQNPKPGKLLVPGTKIKVTLEP